MGTFGTGKLWRRLYCVTVGAFALLATALACQAAEFKLSDGDLEKIKAFSAANPERCAPSCSCNKQPAFAVAIISGLTA